MTLDVGTDTVDAHSQVGRHEGPAFSFDLPAANAGTAAYWRTHHGHEIVEEVLALMHLPFVDKLVLALPHGASDADRLHLQHQYTRHHRVRHTECRSQTLNVTVRHVEVTQNAADATDAGETP